MKKTLLFLMLSSVAAYGQVAIPVTNAVSTGTTINETAIVNSTNNAVISTTSSTAVPTYIVVGSPGTSGQAQLATLGPAACVMDSTLASGAAWYYVIASVTNAGYCHAQAAAPSSGVWVIGYLASQSTTTGVTAVVNVNSYIYGGSGGGGGSGTVNSGTSNHVGIYPATGNAISSDSLLDDGATTANTLTYTGTGGVSSPLVNIGTNPSASGTLNLPNSGKITSRNSGNSADIDMFRINGSNLLQVLSPEFSQVASAASAPAIYYTGTLYNSGTGTTNFPYWYINNGPTAPTTFSTSGEEFGINAPSGYTGNFLNFFTNGSASRFSVDYLGDVNATQVSTNASGAGNFQAYNSAGTFYTNWSSGATANNTIQGFAAAPVTGDVVDCVTTSTTCLLTDSGVLAANIITAITTTGSTGPAVQTGHSLNIPQYSGGGSLPSSTAGQTYYSNGTTGTATSAITVGGTTVGTALGTGGVEVNATLFEDTFAANSYATFNGSCASGVTTSCTITNGGNLDPLGGVVWAGAGDGSNDGEWIKYSSATSTTITFAASGRGYWGSTANTHGSGVQLPLVTKAVVRSASTAPYMISLQTGSTYYFPNATQSNNLGTGLGFAMGTTLFLQNGIAFSLDGNNKNYLAFNFGQIYSTNASSNVTLELSGNSLDYAIATQAITGNGTLTAITNAKTPQLQNNGSAAAAGTGGVLSSHCTIIWSQATAGTVAFGVAASATPGHVWVKEQDSGGTYVAPVFTTITTTTTTQTSGTVTPSAFGTNYATDLWIAMDPGTSNSPSIQLYASASANTLTIQPGTGCTAWQ